MMSDAQFFSGLTGSNATTGGRFIGFRASGAPTGAGASFLVDDWCFTTHETLRGPPPLWGPGCLCPMGPLPASPV